MKKFLIVLILIIFALSALGIYINVNQTFASNDYLRIHIRANSNNDNDQKIKYEIKEKFVEYLTPKICFCTSKADVIVLLESENQNLKKLADDVLQKNGFDYYANIKISSELFPTRTYEGYTLESGIYDALIVELGEAQGNNWWCVIYPPLCFTEYGGQSCSSYVYKSKIWEIIKSFFNR